MVKIIADTTSCLPEHIRSKYGIPVVPQMVHFGERSFTEGIDIDNLTFLRLLREASSLPKTSAPPPDMFRNIFEQYQNSEESIICIHPSSELSGTIRSAETAKLDFPALDIRVIDTRLVASPLGVVVHQAALLAQKGLTVDQLCVEITQLSTRGRIYFLVATLDYLARGGRIGGASALLGNVLQIKPILTLSDGRVEPFSKERTFTKALNQIKELVLDEYPIKTDGYLTIMHADNQKIAEELSAFFIEKLKLPAPLISNLPPAIITHAGPGSVAVGFFTE